MSSQKALDSTPILKRRQASKHSMIEINKTRWTPLDDVMLAQGIQQTSSLVSVFLGTKFSCKFTLKEVEERWDALLFNPALSAAAMEEVGLLSAEERYFANSAVLWSPLEEDILAQIASQPEPSLIALEDILTENPSIFHPSRTATSLHYHWSLLRKYNLLCDQCPTSIYSTPTQFSHALLGLKDKDLNQEQSHREMTCLYEKRLQDKKQKVEVVTLEKQLTEWRVILEGSLSENFGQGTLACLKGKHVRYLMTSSRVTIGRSTEEGPVDVDLSKEGPAIKISRKQAFIEFKFPTTKFYITNTGRCHMFVNDTPLMSGNSTILEDMCLIAFGELSFIFFINPTFPDSCS